MVHNTTKCKLYTATSNLAHLMKMEEEGSACPLNVHRIKIQYIVIKLHVRLVYLMDVSHWLLFCAPYKRNNCSKMVIS